MRLNLNYCCNPAVFSLCLLLSGCGGASIAERHGLGDGPNLDKSFDIKGTDANSNGLRDDVEEYIDSTYKKPEQRQAIKQYAQSLQREALVNYQSVNDKPKKKKRDESNEFLKQKTEEAKIAVVETYRAVACVFESFKGNFVEEPIIVIMEMNSLMQNTLARSSAVSATRAMAGRYVAPIKSLKPNCD